VVEVTLGQRVEELLLMMPSQEVRRAKRTSI
jgi:hypothetical protein